MASIGPPPPEIFKCPARRPGEERQTRFLSGRPFHAAKYPSRVEGSRQAAARDPNDAEKEGRPNKWAFEAPEARPAYPRRPESRRVT